MTAILAIPIYAQDDDAIRERDECADQDARVRDYLRRRGDRGVIDPEWTRDRVRDEYERWSRREGRGPRPLSIGGTTWVNIGPTNFAGRIHALAPHPTVGGTLYAGSATGGVWKTTDSGANWTPLTEGVADLAVGSIAVSASSPLTIYVGTGEVVPGIGMMKSIDGGTSWTFPEAPGMVKSSEYYAVSVNPSNASDVLVGTGSGGFRSSDGAQHWSAWVIPGSVTAVRQIIRDPTNANTLYATTLGSTATIMKSVDGGSNWTSFSSGLPTVTNEIKIAISSNATTMYAAFDSGGVAYVYKSVSGGSWANTSAVSPSGLYFGQPSYNNAIVVAPGTTDTVIMCGSICSKTTTGGTLWAGPTMTGGSYHVDVHDLQYDAAGTLYFATDGGIYTSPDSGNNSVARNTGLITAQFYKITADRSNIDRTMGGLQDNGTWRRFTGGSTTWDFLISSDGQGCALSGANPSLGWASNQAYSGGNYLWQTKNIAGAASPPPLFVFISPIFPATEYLPFDTQIEVDPQRPFVLYTNTTRLWRSMTGGDAFAPLPTTTTDGSTWNSYMIDSIAIAPTDYQTIMVAKGFDIYRTTDGGQTWVKRDTGLPGYFVNSVTFDPFDANVAYAGLATTSGTSVYYTSNGGSTWTARSSGLPSFSAEVIRVDPTDDSTVYCGTDVGVYRSTDRGMSWSRFGTGMPNVAVYDLAISTDGALLRAGTHGRGVWDLQVIPSFVDHAPTATISSPASPMTVAKGTSVSFTGSIADADGGYLTGAWLFPDTWESSQMSAAGSSTITHTFNSAGIWPVSLYGRDADGTTGSAVINITVNEVGETCASPISIPTTALPVTVSVNTETYATATDATDPTLACYFGGSRPSYTAWFTFTAPSTGTYDFSTCGSNFDTVLGAFTGSCGALTIMSGGCSDDIDPYGSSGCPNGGSTVSVALTAGQTIHLMAGGKYFYTSRGLLVLTASMTSSTAPMLTKISANAGPSTGGSFVTLYGKNFASGMSVALGGTNATSVSMLTSNVATAIAPIHAAGIVDVTVTNTDMQSGKLSSGYTYVNCTISLSSYSLNAWDSGMTGTVNVTATSGCGWTPIPNVSWITTASSGVGNGTIAYTIANNPLTTSRTGTMTVGNQTFTVMQNGVVPGALEAYPVSTTSIVTQWQSSAVDHYEIWRNSGAGFVQIATSTSLNYIDSPVATNKVYVYKVRAVDSLGHASAFSNNEIAGTIFFTDDPLVAGTTVIKAVHLTELRDAVNAVRTTAGMPAATWTDDPPAGATIKAIHIIELRNALDPARNSLGLDALSYTPIMAGSIVTTSEFTELRNGVR